MQTSAKPSITFVHSVALRTRTTRVLTAIDRDKDATRHAGALSSVVVELTEAGFDYYFLKPVRQAKLGFVSRQTASLGMASALRVMSPIIRSVLAVAPARELRVISRHIRQLMQSSPKGPSRARVPGGRRGPP